MSNKFHSDVPFLVTYPRTTDGLGPGGHPGVNVLALIGGSQELEAQLRELAHGCRQNGIDPETLIVWTPTLVRVRSQVAYEIVGIDNLEKT